MKKYNKQNNSQNYSNGFTIIEALIAIFILSVSVVSMLGVNATSSSFARYANNEIIANYLNQEAIDSIRNSRDTIAFQNKLDNDTGQAWKDFLNRYGYKEGFKSKCFDSQGCHLRMESFDPNLSTDSDYLDGDDVVTCPNDDGCPFLRYNSDTTNFALFYTTTGDSESIFKRTIKMEVIKDDEVKIVATVDWNNGNGITKNSSRSLEMYLLNWSN